jgi:hypothetical protein
MAFEWSEAVDRQYGLPLLLSENGVDSGSSDVTRMPLVGPFSVELFAKVINPPLP